MTRKQQTMAIALQPKSLKAKLRRTLLPPAKVAKIRGRSKRSRAFLTRLRRLPTSLLSTGNCKIINLSEENILWGFKI